MELKFSNKVSPDSYEILLHGEFGNEINGREIAKEIMFLDLSGIKNITLRINSVGGSVVDGYSIIGAMNSADAKFTTINEGVAYSTASWILANGDNRIAMDYSTALIHDPFEADGKESNVLNKIKESIQTMLSNYTGRSIDNISIDMSVETVMDSTEQETYGIVDKCVTTKKKKAQGNKYELMNYYKSNTNKMDKVFNKLGVDSEDGVLLKLAETENTHKIEVQNLKTNETELKNKISELEAKVENSEKVTIEATFNKAVEDGKYSADQKEEILLIANSLGSDKFASMINGIKTPHVDVKNIINTKDGTQETKEKKDWAWYEKNDPKALLDMESKNPELFNKLQSEDLKKYE